MPDRDLQIHRAEEWSALYIDGKLERVGDHYLIDERLYELFDVTIVEDDAFLRGQTQRAGVAPTVGDVVAYAAARDDRRRQAAAKVEQAQRLLDEARELNPRINPKIQATGR